MEQDFVLESKKIEIPGFPHAFNPSIIRWKGSLLMSFRVIPNAKNPMISWLGLIWLDDNFDPIGPPQQLNIRNGNTIVPPRAEDARLITVGEKLYIVYSDNCDPIITKGGFRLYIGELNYNGLSFSVKNLDCLTRFEGASQNIREKNWVPFDYKGKLLLAYSLDPHRILQPLPGMGSCETFAISKGTFDWDWGVLRGGTPGIIDGDHYLSFFHSSKKMATVHSNNQAMPHYFMGAYTFALEPPFEITGISPEPIIKKGFYSEPIYERYWGSVRVVFPCGYIFDEDYVWIAYGRQDHEACVLKLDKKGLLKSLVPIDRTTE